MINLPVFKIGPHERKWIKGEHLTSQVIQCLWQHALPRDRRDTEFLKVLIRCAWVNSKNREPTRKWRNRHIAAWLGIDERSSDEQIAEALARRLHMSNQDATQLVETESGITDYYKPFRPAFLKQVEKQSKTISRAFSLLSMHGKDSEQKIRRVASMILDLPKFKVSNGGQTMMMNGLAPALASLDPDRRFPIMNSRTAKLLSVIGKKADVEGALALSRLIGQKGIEDSQGLDVYAQTQLEGVKAARRSPSKPKAPNSSHTPKLLGIKAEEAAVAYLAKRKATIRKEHNKLTNRFRKAVEWTHEIQEGVYDILIEDWKPDRKLLIEAKTDTRGVGGRSQLRQAIGQLFDYRFRLFHGDMKKVDLALLTPQQPDQDVLDLLASLGIEALWFERDELSGTISLN